MSPLQACLEKVAQKWFAHLHCISADKINDTNDNTEGANRKSIRKCAIVNSSLVKVKTKNCKGPFSLIWRNLGIEWSDGLVRLVSSIECVAGRALSNESWLARNRFSRLRASFIGGIKLIVWSWLTLFSNFVFRYIHFTWKRKLLFVL
jgi:hypothetical protein